jgi:hypothetical protein
MPRHIARRVPPIDPVPAAGKCRNREAGLPVRDRRSVTRLSRSTVTGPGHITANRCGAHAASRDDVASTAIVFVCIVISPWCSVVAVRLEAL